ncbi:MAG: helix-turn-helix domain-containing protein [Aliifodinibius sp.]|nr:helix-turn-helix domain-containing protein [candidate division Zixibacteria bacterium]NIT57218.1 helix-turn-helix domain-containing protein [Fodinibius sp.]NIW40174.1 helix-turn-helix domain-containing protein [candidate division Zixibacteria bacterium]NIX56293.1 helix-turn-helix domain-containing protein [candidate division Zixibacteria bacterium]NIY25800.1 helix-turn-helix domain-containing protein [Fodinibius sp.]
MQEIAEYLGVKESTIYKWTHEEYIPHIKLGKFLRFKTRDIDKWIDKKAKNGRMTRRINVD